MNSIALPFRLKLAFGVGQSATGAMNISLALFLLFYYHREPSPKSLIRNARIP